MAMGNLWQDLKFGARLLRLNPGFAAIAMLSLALGIGANTAIFQLLDAVRLRTLPVKNPQELAVVRIDERKWSSGRFEGPYSDLTNAIWEQIRDRQEGFSGIFAWAADQFNLATGGEARYVRGNWVSGDYFRVLGEQPLLGRVFSVADDRRGCGAPGAVISYGFWQREFGGDASALGRKITIEGHPFQIIGITSPGFYGVEVGRSYDVAVLICSEPVIRGEDSMYEMRHGWWLSAMGRLKPGWTLQRATAQLKASSPAILEAAVPPVYKPDSVKKYMEYRFAAFSAENGFSNLRREYENPLWTLLAIAGLVLLIACANLANLMLARASAREREIGVRLSLGASRGRLIRQLLAESLLLAVAGAALGALLSQALSRGMVVFLSTENAHMFCGFACGLARAGIHVGTGDFDVRDFRAHAGAACHSRGSGGGAEIDWAGDDRGTRTVRAAASAGSVAGGAVAGVAGRRAAVCAHAAKFADAGSGISAARRAGDECGSVAAQPCRRTPARFQAGAAGSRARDSRSRFGGRRQHRADQRKQLE
jgi:predicted permease